MGRDIRNVMVVIPSLNPDGKLTGLVSDLKKQGFAHVVVIDDGSRQECQPIYDQLRAMDICTVLVHPVNRGQGAGLKTGCQYFIDNRERLGLEGGVVTADSDGQHLPEDIARVAQAMLENPDYLILGARDLNDESMPKKNRTGNRLTAQMFRVLYGRAVPVMTGLRGVPASWMEQCVACEGERFEYAINMLIAALRQGVPVKEITIQTVYFDNNKVTTFHPLRDSIQVGKAILAPFLRFSCSSLVCAVLDQGLFALFRKFVFAGMAATAGIWAATASARVLSCLSNYALNRTVVFRSTGNSRRSLIRYGLLAVVQLSCSAGLVAGIHALTRLSPSALKLPVDILLFFISYRIQQRWVFQ